MHLMLPGAHAWYCHVFMCVLTRTYMNPHVLPRVCAHAASHHPHATSLMHACLAECMRVKRIGHAELLRKCQMGMVWAGACTGCWVQTGSQDRRMCYHTHALTCMHTIMMLLLRVLCASHPHRTQSKLPASCHYGLLNCACALCLSHPKHHFNAPTATANRGGTAGPGPSSSAGEGVCTSVHASRRGSGCTERGILGAADGKR